MEQSTTQFVWKGIDLEDLRQVMDKPSDDAVASVIESESLDHLRVILKSMAENDAVVSDELPVPMHNFVQKELEIAFSEHDIKMFKQANKIWIDHGMQFIFILFFRALPYTYMAEKPANVLRMTRLLESHTERRIIETAQFVFDVMDKNWWEPDNRGILTALKIRIMHSAMRHAILDSEKVGLKWNKAGERWNTAWGQPISQEDLIATNQVFSLEFIKGMVMLGQPLSTEEQKAWFHTWKTIAKIMGVQDNLICDTVDEAWDLQHTIYSHLFRDETISGIPLAKALVDTLNDNFYLPEKLVLFLMKAMLADEQFPDCFNRMLGPSFAEAHPELFINHASLAAEQRHRADVLFKQLHSHAMDFYKTMEKKKSDIKGAEPESGIIMKIVNWVLGKLGFEKKKIHMIDTYIKILHDLLHDLETGEPLEKLEEDSIKEIMTSVGGIMVALLSIHFRKGKESGFRIPKDLQENWALKG